MQGKVTGKKWEILIGGQEPQPKIIADDRLVDLKKYK
jgi:hypothetical protein